MTDEQGYPEGAELTGNEPTVPRRPYRMDPRELGFTPRPPVPWLAPKLLVSTGIRTVLAMLFGAYLDKRELQNSMPSVINQELGAPAPAPAQAGAHSGSNDGGSKHDGSKHDGSKHDGSKHDGSKHDGSKHGAGNDGAGSGEDGLWLDYVADLGDGFNATYSIAYLLGRPSIEVDGHHLPRGGMLVMGGDQVYPTASGQAYEDRCKGPYQAALPYPPTTGPAPALYAVPGNHDWYDGLTAFLRLFVRSGDDNIGGWRTPQARSYFAVELPAGWWLLALDGQSGAYLDDPQLRYFEEVATRLHAGSRVILAVPEPSWLKAVDNPGAYDSIDYFVRTIVAPTGADIRLLISGDLHHYNRYSTPDRELITCGGGGAYLYPTHKLPNRIEVPPPDTLARRATRSRSFRLAGRYPDAARSRRYGWGIFGRLPLRNPGFVTLLGSVHTLLMLAMAGVAAPRSEIGVQVTAQRLFSVPLALMLLVTVLGAAFFAKPPSAGGKRHVRHWILGLSHGFAHVGLAAAGTWAWLALPFYDWPWPLPAVAAAVLYGPASGLAASQLTAGYLLLASAFGVNLNELFAGQGIEDAKGFLRMHIAPDGTLTVYPVAVDRICRDWRPDPDGPPDRAWLAPRQPLRTRLAEPPVTLR